MSERDMAAVLRTFAATTDTLGAPAMLTEAADHIDRLQQQVRELTEWRPMETAPRPDVPFLALVDGEEVRVVMWTKTSHVPLYGWCLVDQGAEDCDLCEPTHWLPLPSLPTSDAGGADDR